MPLKANVFRDFPDLPSLDARDKQKLIIWASNVADVLETISRRAQEAGEIAKEVQAQQQTLISNLATPSITHSQDSVLGSVGNLSADLTTKIVGLVVVGGKIAVRDNNGNVINFLTE
jgi:cell division FtsZ-interacting protein ZapD